VIASASSASLDWEASAAPASGPLPSLAALELGVVGAVVLVDLEEDLMRWLAAIGIARGDRVTVLRRAPFGGPIHLRTHTGGEFAVDRSLALRIHVEPARAEGSKGAA
jgi:ferrous iron transport protein A